MQKMTFAMVSANAVLGLPACNTMKGIGKDLEQGGGAIQKAAK